MGEEHGGLQCVCVCVYVTMCVCVFPGLHSSMYIMSPRGHVSLHVTSVFVHTCVTEWVCMCVYKVCVPGYI